MKDNYYHICIASEREVMFRVDDDYRRAFNSLALAVQDTDSVLLADAIMSNHIHFCVQSRCPGELVRRFRFSYQRYFNAKNPLHHGVCITPFEYRHSSVKVYFRKNLGNELPTTTRHFSMRNSNLPCNRQLPDGFCLDADGQILRDSVIDVRHVENLFGSPQDFLINMVRFSTKKWRDNLAGNLNDNSLMTLAAIESDRYLESVLEKNEHGKCVKTPYSDIFICNLLDNELLPQNNYRSVYQMDIHQKLTIGRMLNAKFGCSISQLGRCLAATDDSFFRLFYKRV